MFLTVCTDFVELVQFLKLDYANNLYFFTYLDECSIRNPGNKIFIGRINGKIVISILLTPVHCSISSLNLDYIGLIADQIPSLNSIHVVGRSDYVKKLLSVSKGPQRDSHAYALCQLHWHDLTYSRSNNATRAVPSDWEDLVRFYNENDMLYDAGARLPAIMDWGRVYYIRHDQSIVSCVLTTTETEDAAMIGAVFTNPGHRNNGYARACITDLCKDLFQSGKTAYLYYKSDDLSLQKLYGGMGFRKISNWMLATKTK